MLSSSLPQRRVGFYPCCASDVREPLEILAGQVDHVIFCDRFNQSNWKRSRFQTNLSVSKYPSYEFRVGPWRDVVLELEPIHLLFYRRDSNGEGGSHDSAIALSALELLFSRMSDPCWIITDGKYDPDNLIESIVKQSRAVCAGRLLKLEANEAVAKLGLVRLWASKLE